MLPPTLTPTTSSRPHVASQELSESIGQLDFVSAKHSSTHNSRIGIISYVTHSSHLNYGATLHGYAFQKYLWKTYNVASTVIDYIPKALKGENLKYPILNKKGKSSLFHYLLRKANWTVCFLSNIRKYNKFKIFKEQFLKITPKTYDYDSLGRTEKIEGVDIGLFVCEADVIWKINALDLVDENFFLDFPAANGKFKVAYAPTISSKEFPNDVLEYFKLKTKDFHAISAREGIGAKYLSEILNRPVAHVLDPTLLLDEEDYDKILVKPKEKDYLLIYNCTANDIEMVRMAIEYGKQNKLKVIEISNYGVNRFICGHKVKTDIGLREWLGYMKYAHIIFTNSFHGICFAVIFKKDFFVFQRDNKDYRMPDIINSLGIEGRLIPCGSHRAIPQSVNPINYTNVYNKLECLRDKSREFISHNIIKPISSKL